MVRLLSPTSLSKSKRRSTSPRRKGRPAKGSAAAKAMMAKVRAAKKGKRKSPVRKSTRKMRSPAHAQAQGFPQAQVNYSTPTSIAS